MSNNHTTLPKQASVQTDEDDDEQQEAGPLPPYARLSIEPGETRYVTAPEAVGLHFNSFIPQADITSQVHFISNVQANSVADTAGFKDGDRILQVNGVNVTNLEHEDVRKLMQLMAPIVFTVAHDPKYLLLLQEPVNDLEEKPPEPPVVSSAENETELKGQQPPNRSELPRRPSIDSLASLASVAAPEVSKSRHCEVFDISKADESLKGEPLKAKLCRLRRSKRYAGYGLVLKFQKHLHVIGEVESGSPTHRSGLRENDVIVFVGKSNVEKLAHDDVKVMIRAMTLAANQVDLTVMAKSDIPKYKTLQERGLVDWSAMGLEK